MANLLQQMVSDDFVWTAVTSALTGRRKRASTGFINIDCPMCINYGHNPDRRQRCGVKNNNPGVGVHCFNCGFDTKWKPGESLSRKLRDFMMAVGVAEIEVKRLNHRAAAYRRLVEVNPEAQALIPSNFSLEFPSKPLPAGAASFETWAERGCTEPDFIDVVTYLYGRGDDIAASTTFFWTPSADNNMSRRVIIPFYRKGQIVGWTARLIDKPKALNPDDPDSLFEPKYYQQRPQDFIFNNHVMEDRDRKYIIVCEGPLDALAIDGVAVLSASISDRQAAWIDSMGKTVIVLPDHDKAGDRLIDIAMKRNWQVSMPLLNSGSSYNWWENDIKDAADAVQRYGRLYSLTSIIASATANKTGISIKRKMRK